MERKIALCVSQWSADSTLYAWSYAKQYFLRVCIHRLRLSELKMVPFTCPIYITRYVTACCWGCLCSNLFSMLKLTSH